LGFVNFFWTAVIKNILSIFFNNIDFNNTYGITPYLNLPVISLFLTGLFYKKNNLKIKNKYYENLYFFIFLILIIFLFSFLFKAFKSPRLLHLLSIYSLLLITCFFDFFTKKIVYLMKYYVFSVLLWSAIALIICFLMNNYKIKNEILYIFISIVFYFVYVKFKKYRFFKLALLLPVIIYAFILSDFNLKIDDNMLNYKSSNAHKILNKLNEDKNLIDYRISAELSSTYKWGNKEYLNNPFFPNLSYVYGYYNPILMEQFTDKNYFELWKKITGGYVFNWLMPPVNTSNLNFKIFGIKYLLSNSNPLNEYKITQLKDYLRLWFTDKYKIIPSSNSVIEKIGNNEFNVNKITLLESLENEQNVISKINHNQYIINDNTQIIPLIYEDLYVKVKIINSKSGFLNFNDLFSKYWEVYDNGTKKESLRSYSCFRSVFLEPGEHIVEWKYSLNHINQWMLLSLITLSFNVVLAIKNINVRVYDLKKI